MTKLTIQKNSKVIQENKINSETLEQFNNKRGFKEINNINGAKARSRWNILGWSLFIILVGILILIHLAASRGEKFSKLLKIHNNNIELSENCKILLAESIPIGLNYSNGSVVHTSTYDAWMKLIASAQSTIEIASMYWTMRRDDVYPDDSAKEGEEVFAALENAGKNRNVSLKIAQSPPSKLNPNKDTEYLINNAKAEVRTVDIEKLIGSGILHTKLWLIDRKHVYVGSANMDWRALTQIKELGIYAMNCPIIAKDLAKIFDIYWLLGEQMKIPAKWPEEVNTNINVNNPLKFELNGNKYKSFFSSSPPQFSPSGRTNDLDAILTCISRAKQFIYVSVMDYFPLMIYASKVKFWPVIDDALRKAAINRKVQIRLLISWWKHSRKSEDSFLKSLESISGSYNGVEIEVKRFIVPSTSDQDKIPYVRVNHNKYMVTDDAAYIGTSNWCGDYFAYTSGIGMVFEDDASNNQNSLRQQLEDIFNRDWNSPYASNSTGSNPLIN